MSYLELKQDRERKCDIITMYPVGVDELRQTVREFREEIRVPRQSEAQAQRERYDLIAERDRAQQKAVVWELLQGWQSN
ncbi:hypothetical protein V1525DRAFT_391591 [Lipomyces kononenkoae]|uniref:Uncharacterized protein n=1 Tax=Lipomyces kononenkoae TaxID=34357 RepID=A0ACC3SU66_LIPKO